VAQHRSYAAVAGARADPNDEETPYHAAEGYDHAVLRVLLESGKAQRVQPDDAVVCARATGTM